MNKRKWKPKTKAEIVLEGLTLSSDDAIAKLCQIHGIRLKQYRQWEQDFIQNAHRAFAPQWHPKVQQILGVGLFAIAGLYLLAIPLGLVEKDNRLGTPEIVLIGLLLVLLSNVVERLAEITVSSTGMSARFQDIEERQDTLQSEVDTLRVVLKGIVTDYEQDKLRGLASENPFIVHYRSSLYGELKRLDAMGYIRPQEGYGISDIRRQYEKKREEQFDLKQYVRITEEGREYLSLRDELFMDAGESSQSFT